MTSSNVPISEPGSNESASGPFLCTSEIHPTGSIRVEPVGSDYDGDVCTAKPETEELEEILDQAERPVWVHEVGPDADHPVQLIHPTRVTVVHDDEDDDADEGREEEEDIQSLNHAAQDDVQPRNPGPDIQEDSARLCASRPESADLLMSPANNQARSAEKQVTEPPAEEEKQAQGRYQRARGYLIALCYYHEVRTIAALFVGIILIRLFVTAVTNYLRKSSGDDKYAVGLMLVSVIWLWRQIRHFANGAGLDMFRLSRNEDVRNATIVLTGGGRGIGREVALRFCRLKVKRLVLCMRCADARTTKLRAELASALGNHGMSTDIIGIEMDLASRSSVVSGCERIKAVLTESWKADHGTENEPPARLIDCMVLNAGVATGDAIMTVNWLHHVVMIEQLKEYTQRIVCLSSIAHGIGCLPKIKEDENKGLDVELVDGAASLWGDELVRYGSSKLAMLLEVEYLHSVGTEAYAVHPGWVNTDMVNEILLFRLLTAIFSKSIEYGAMTVVGVALKVNTKPGGYHETGRAIRTFPSAHGLGRHYQLIRQRALAGGGALAVEAGS